MNIPKVTPTIIYDGTDISEDVAPFLLSVSVEESIHGESDRVEIQLDDIAARWVSEWFPGAGASLDVAFSLADWFAPGRAEVYRAGGFRLASMTIKAPPSRVSLVGLTADVTRSMRREKKTRAFQHTTLKKVAEEIAGEHGLVLLYEAPTISIKRKEQHLTPDLSFIRSLAEPYGLFLKVAESKMILVSPSKLAELQPPPRPLLTRDEAESYARLVREATGAPSFTSFEFRYQVHATYKAARVVYADQDAGSDLKVEVEADGIESGERLVENVQAFSRRDAELQAAAMLERENRKRLTAVFELPGRPDIAAGSVLDLGGFGRFSRPMIVFKARHVFDRGGYRTSLDLIDLTPNSPI